MGKKSFILLLIIFVWNSQIKTQVIGNYVDDESKLYAETKQVNQFFRRFNNEEGADGIRYSSRSKEYRNPDTRNKYLEILFDLENESLSADLKKHFIDTVNNDSLPYFLDFHGDNWFAEVKTKFLYRGKPSYITFYMELEQENLGYKWVMTNVFFEDYAQIMQDENLNQNKFLHPMSHELDFMNFIKVFDDKQDVEEYTSKGYSPDYLSIFLYEFKQGLFEYQTVMDLKFHFFQIPGWYFELEKFNRPGYNTGWLISRLTPITKEEKTVLMKYIYHD
jgi:hypothetical protein